MRLSVQAEAFDLGAESNAFAASVVGAGAVVTFTGLVRDNGGLLAAMEIEHYPGMTEKALADIVAHGDQPKAPQSSPALSNRVDAYEPTAMPASIGGSAGLAGGPMQMPPQMMILLLQVNIRQVKSNP